jgi:ribonucleotide monophosphatase NagD (HAD superfamily)
MNPITLTEEQTHVIFVQNDSKFSEPIFKNELKSASDAADDIIKSNPAAKCYVFQIRTILSGEINIIRTDFNHAATK